jgi:hypothetical protein
MTSEELSRTVADLEQYVTEVWDARKLWHIATVFHFLDGESDPDSDQQGESELTDAQQRAMWKKYADDLDDHLFAAYRNATQRTNEVLTGIVGHDGIEILLERLSNRVHNLIAPEPNQWAWRGLTQGDVKDYLHPSVIEQNDLLTVLGIDIEKDPSDGVLSIADWIWSQIRSDVQYYITKLAAFIDQFRTGISVRTAPEPIVNLERIQWNGTAALLGYLFNELVRTNYITPPQRKENGELKPNWAAVARTLHASFDIRKKDGDAVTLAALEQVFKMGGADYKSGPRHFTIR